MKSRLSLRNLARAGLNLIFISSLILGCSSSTSPTYVREDLETAIKSICQEEYDITVVTKLAKKTLWVYFPVEDMLIKSDKPEKYSEKFSIEENTSGFNSGVLELKYAIKGVPEEEKTQEYTYNKDILEKMNNVWKVLRRVIFSMDSSSGKEPEFFIVVTADIKNGIETKDLFYIQDLKKFSYELISLNEYQHRAVQDMGLAPDSIGDKEGLHLDYRDINLEEFVTLQIQHRVKLKFQRPEVEKGADIDKEILKIALYALKIYNLRGFSEVELHNLLTKNRIILNRAAISAMPIE